MKLTSITLAALQLGLAAWTIRWTFQAFARGLSVFDDGFVIAAFCVVIYVGTAVELIVLSRQRCNRLHIDVKERDTTRAMATPWTKDQAARIAQIEREKAESMRRRLGRLSARPEWGQEQ